MSSTQELTEVQNSLLRIGDDDSTATERDYTAVREESSSVLEDDGSLTDMGYTILNDVQATKDKIERMNKPTPEGETPLTEINGVGQSTADELKVDGFHSVEQVAIGYLTDKGETIDGYGRINDITDVVHQSGITDGELLDNPAKDRGDRSIVKYMLFVRENYIKTLSVESECPMKGKYTYAKPDKLKTEFEHLKYDKSIRTADGICQLDANLSKNPQVTTDNPEVVMDSGRDYEVVGSFTRHNVAKEYVDMISDVFGYDVTQNRDSIHINDNSSDMPVVFEDDETGICIAVAPRIVNRD